MLYSDHRVQNRLKKAVLSFVLLLVAGSCTFGQLPDPKELFPADQPKIVVPTAQDSAMAAILASDSLTAYELAKLEVPVNPWNLSLQSNVNMNQSAYTGNWDKDEKGAYVWTANIDGRAQKQVGILFNTRTILKLAFGQTHTQNNSTKDWATPSISTDRVDLESLLRLTLGGFVDPFVSGRFQSSFFDTRDNEDYFYINPSNYTEAIGVSKALWRNNDKEVLTRAGFALRQAWDRNFPKPDTDPVIFEDRFTYDGGLEVVTDMKLPLFNGKVNYNGRLSLYQALFFSEQETEKNDYWRMIDLDFESRFTANITKVLQVSLYAWWRYDKEIDKAGRLKQGLSFGMAYTLI